MTTLAETLAALSLATPGTISYLNAASLCIEYMRSPEFAELVADSKRLDAIQSEYWKVDPFAMPTPGGDDADVGWRVSSYYQAEPKEREVATEYSDNLRTAIDQAIAQAGAAGGGES